MAGDSRGGSTVTAQSTAAASTQRKSKQCGWLETQCMCYSQGTPIRNLPVSSRPPIQRASIWSRQTWTSMQMRQTRSYEGQRSTGSQTNIPRTATSRAASSKSLKTCLWAIHSYYSTGYSSLPHFAASCIIVDGPLVVRRMIYNFKCSYK